MKILGINANSDNQQFKITEDDQLWVEENFRWIKEFLLEQGNVDKAKEFFLKSAEKTEEEGIRKLQELDPNSGFAV